MAKCTFCDKHIEPGRGVTYVSPDSINHYCSSKCIKNVKLGRDKKYVGWVRKRKSTAEEMKQEILEAGKEKESKVKAEIVAEKK
ncbi:MAG: 50S ribosomal protein L24e [archaeon]